MKIITVIKAVNEEITDVKYASTPALTLDTFLYF